MVKAMTILTTNEANMKKNVKAAKKNNYAYEPSFTNPAERNANMAYVNLAGVMYAVK